MSILQENKPAIRFLLTFIVLYISMNTAYGLFTGYYLPQADPITESVSRQVVFFLSFFDPSVNYATHIASKNVAISNHSGLVINVFEGCNGVNVFIVFTSFIIAFRGSLRQTILAVMAGLLIIHLMNLIRVTLLYGVEIYFPQHLYFFHKYLFTGIIYGVVFFLWFRWVRMIRPATNPS